MRPSTERLPAGWTAIEFDEIDSTNSEAMRRATVGERGPLWITARLQTRGRGRSGRAWASAGASLAATLMFSPRCPVPALAGLSLVSGVAAYDAIAGALPEAKRHLVRLKWPNDVLIGRAKLVGILVESSIIGEDVVAVIGTGINIGAVPDVGGRETTALVEHGSSADFASMSAALAEALARWIEVWSDGRGFSAIRQVWLERSGPVGEPMTVNAGGELVAGRYAGLDDDGGLLLDVGQGAPRKFSFGDVALAPPSV
jgi:BirA family biotin operon repressor/biotin-[acetyl-CoA-carboxylase] ligase